MKTIYRFVAEHPGICRACLYLGLFSFTFAAMGNEHTSFLSVYLLDLALLFLGSRFINVAPGKLLQDPLAILDSQCDPYPFLAEAERQMARRDLSPQRQVTELQYATALRMVGQNQKCAEILENINIDRYVGVTPQMKFMYYNNLSDVLFTLNRTLEAQIWHKKAKRIYEDMPEGKAKQSLTHVVQISEADDLYYRRDYDLALRKVAWINCQSQRCLMDAALLAAKCHIALEEPEKAREKLNYVVQHGNKLHIVQEAKELLETLN